MEGVNTDLKCLQQIFAQGFSLFIIWLSKMHYKSKDFFLKNTLKLKWDGKGFVMLILISNVSPKTTKLLLFYRYKALPQNIYMSTLSLIRTKKSTVQALISWIRKSSFQLSVFKYLSGSL